MNGTLTLLDGLTTWWSTGSWKDLVTYRPEEPLIFTRFFFWGFFAVVLSVYAVVHRWKGMRNAYLFLVSLFFYYKTSGLFVAILIFSTFSDYFVALAMHRTRNGLHKKLWLALALTINLFLLCYFKYAHFLITNINAAFGTSFHEVNWFALWSNGLFGTKHLVDRILLPVGISFFTFQAISYAMDVYRGHVEPVRNILDYGFFVSFFPQLVAGPIVRASEFLPQLKRDYLLTRAAFGMAVFWILNGLLKKLVIGDYIAVNFIDRVFADPLRYTGYENLMALYAYSLQVYADFSGYTDIAIGVALLLGFQLPTNFNSPYKADSVTDFWRRWHMSLSTWLRDYLYIPMGGNRGGSTFSWIMLGFIGVALMLLTGWLWLPVVYLSAIALIVVLVRAFPAFGLQVSTNVNLMLTMLIGGLWHGASWMFVIWGGLNGLALVFHKYWKRISPWAKDQRLLVHATAVFLTFSFITFTRIWFRSDSLETADRILHQIGSAFGWHLIPEVTRAFAPVFTVTLIGLIIHWLPATWKQRYRERFVSLPLPAMAVVCVLVVALIHQTLSAEMQPFIYFQF
ncbi:MAG TPA: MBOAT family O-acyltransferase [Flavobacteriales bacterium]